MHRTFGNSIAPNAILLASPNRKTAFSLLEGKVLFDRGLKFIGQLQPPLRRVEAALKFEHSAGHFLTDLCKRLVHRTASLDDWNERKSVLDHTNPRLADRRIRQIVSSRVLRRIPFIIVHKLTTQTSLSATERVCLASSISEPLGEMVAANASILSATPRARSDVHAPQLHRFRASSQEPHQAARRGRI